MLESDEQKMIDKLTDCGYEIVHVPFVKVWISEQVYDLIPAYDVCSSLIHSHSNLVQ